MWKMPDILPVGLQNFLHGCQSKMPSQTGLGQDLTAE